MNNMFRLALVGGLALTFGCNGGGETTPEICDNANVDDDGDGTADCEDSDCAGIAPCDEEVCDNGVDDDGDEDKDCEDSECRSDSACKEDCNNEKDDNGDGNVDCEDDLCEDEDECIPFEPIAMFLEGNFLYDAENDVMGSAIGSDGSPIPPTIGITFAEEAYFDAGDDRYTCQVFWTLDSGAPDRVSLVEGTVTHTGFWMPSTGTYQTNCGDSKKWDPDVWGDDLEAVFTSVEYAVGVGPLSSKLEKDAQWIDFVKRSTSPEFAFDKFVLGAGNGLRIGETEQYSINSYSVGFAVDDGFNILVDDEGNGTLLENKDVLGTETGLLPTAYYRVFAFYGFDPEGLYLQ